MDLRSYIERINHRQTNKVNLEYYFAGEADWVNRRLNFSRNIQIRKQYWERHAPTQL